MTNTDKFPCPKCPDKEPFKNKQALNMHTMRVHTRAGRQGAMWNKKETRAQKLARKRAYNTKVRARNIARGLTGHGDVRKRPVRKSPKFGAKWTTARHKKFKATWESKKNGLLPSTQPQEPDPRVYINNCPNCGYHLQPHYLAAGFKTP